jgi:hypothetical protein
MKKQELLAAISKMEEQLAALKELVLAESEVNEPQEEAPVVNESVEEEREELPAPPKVIYVDLPKKDKTPDEETVIGCQILSKLPDFYDGTCRSIVLQKQWHDNSNKVNPKTGKNYDKLHINKYKVIVTAEDIEGYPIGSTIVHWDTLAKWHAFLIGRGINGHKETKDPHTNWMPNEVSLCID